MGNAGFLRNPSLFCLDFGYRQAAVKQGRQMSPPSFISLEAQSKLMLGKDLYSLSAKKLANVDLPVRGAF